MVGRKQNRIRSSERFKVYKDIFELTKYSPATLKKRITALVKNGDKLEAKYKADKMTYWEFHNRITELKIQWDNTARAILFKQNFKKTMKKFPITLTNRK